MEYFFNRLCLAWSDDNEWTFYWARLGQALCGTNGDTVSDAYLVVEEMIEKLGPNHHRVVQAKEKIQIAKIQLKTDL